MEEEQGSNAMDSVDLLIKALGSASTRLRIEALQKVQRIVEAGELRSPMRISTLTSG